MRPTCTVTLVCLLVLSAIDRGFSQYVPGINNNVTLLSHVDQYDVYSNIWGYTDGVGREYALVGVDAGLSIVDITDPATPVEVDLIPGPTAVGTIWREIKTYSSYAYVVSEHTSPTNLSGLQIIDLSPLPDSASLVNVYLWPGVTGSTARAHSVTVDGQGYLYIQGGTATLGAGGNQGGIRILDLSDPVNPTPVGVFTPRYVHDTFVRDNLLFASDIFDGGHVDILDISDRANPDLVYSLIYPDGFCHNSGTTDDGNYLITTDELPGLTVKVWDIQVLWDSDTTNNDQINLVAEYIGNPAQIAHNVHVSGSYAYLSHYVEGVKVLDIADPTDPVEVGYYDTYPQAGSGFNGDWGVFPYFPSGTFVVSDIQTGLYVLRFDSVRAGGIEGVITSSISGTSLSDVTGSFVEANKTTISDTDGFYELRTNEGDHTIIFAKTGYVSDTAYVTLPPGANITFDVSLDSNLADIQISATSFTMLLPIDTTATTQLIVTNAGKGGLLSYTVDDLVGPGLRAARAQIPKRAGRPSLAMNLEPFTIAYTQILSPSVQGHSFPIDTAITDPAGDVVFGTGPDILRVIVDVTNADLNMDFEFVDNIDTDSAFVSISFDTDFDSGTGAFPGGFGFNLPEQDIGAEYDVLLDISGQATGSPMTMFVFEGSNAPGGGALLFTGSLTVNGNLVTTTIPLSAIGNDDGNIAVAGFVGHLDGVNATSIDYMPNEGHGIIGFDPSADLPWLSLSQEAGALLTGESDTITVLFDTHGLDSGQVYAGILYVQSNDPDEPEVTIPVTLNTLPVGVKEDEQLPSVYELKQNYPNPFNPSTRIEYSLPRESYVSLKIYDMLGREVVTLVREDQAAGLRSVIWDGKTATGSRASSGVYFCRMEAKEKGGVELFLDQKKLALVK